MDPTMMKFAQEQMKNMSPQQMQQMAAMAGQMSPEMIKQAQQQMNNMSSEDMQRMQSFMQQNSQQPAGISNMMSQQQNYMYQGALQHKNTGNQLHKAGKYKEAIQKYNSALSNLTTCTSAEALDLRGKCQLNVAQCSLYTYEYDLCIENATAVLQRDEQNVKALYRRGQANTGKGRYAQAVKDLQKALNLSGSDQQERNAIQEKLEIAQQRLAANPQQQSEPLSPTGPTKNGPIIQEVDSENTSNQPNNASQPFSSAQTANSEYDIFNMPGMSMEEKAEKLRQFGDQVEKMSDDELKSFQSLVGQNIDPNMLRMSTSMLKTMSPEQLQQIAQLKQSLGTSTGDDLGAMQNLFSQMSSSQTNPAPTPANQASSASNSGRSVDTAQPLSTGSTAHPTPPNLPNMSPDMMQSAMKLMQGMDSEKLASMSQFAAKMQSGGAPPDAASIANMMSPDLIGTMLNQVRQMDNDTLVNLMQQSQPNTSKEAAAKMVESIKSMSDGQVDMLAKMAPMAASTMQRVQQVKQKLVQNRGIVVGVVLLIVAVILRRYNIV